MSLTRRRLAAALITLAVVIGGPAAYIAWDGLHDQLGPADIAVVLGNQVLPDGRPSRRLAARLDRALDVWRAGLVKRILVSGGFGKEGHDEAKVMAQYLVAHGVPADKVDQDGAGNDTFLTARHTALYLQRERLTSVIVVSQWFHITRCRMALHAFKVRPVMNAHPDYFEARDAFSLVREVFGCAAYAFRDYELR